MTDDLLQLPGSLDAFDLTRLKELVADGAFVDGAILIMRVRPKDGSAYVHQITTDGTDWITERGLLDVAITGDRNGDRCTDPDGDES